MSDINSEIDKLLDTVSLLRKECPWDSKQTHETLVRHLIEEAYEVVNAISNLDNKDSYKLNVSDLVNQTIKNKKDIIHINFSRMLWVD